MGASASVSKFSQDVNFESLDEIQLENAVKGLQTGQLSCLERLTELSEPCAKIVKFIIWYNETELYSEDTVGYQDMVNRARLILSKHGVPEDLLFWPEYPDPDWVVPELETMATRDERVGRSLIIYQQKIEQCLVYLDEIGQSEEFTLDLNLGLPADQIDHFPIVMVTGDQVGDQCPICLADYELDEEVMALSCGHLMHETCARQWFQDRDTCPVCRKNFGQESYWLSDILDRLEDQG